MEKNTQKSEKQKIKNSGFTIWRLLAYFIIYSVVGYIIETCFGLLTKGVIESRKSFLYGPFCAIYGIGAVIMIVSLQYFKKNKYSLFLGGFLIGSIVEYLVSLFGELIFHVKWWDYSNMPFNINGRICIIYSFFWGILAIYLMSHFNPLINKLINKMKERFSTKLLKGITIIVILFIAIDFIVTMFALKMFFARLVYNYDLDLPNAESYIEEYDRLYSNEKINEITEKYFSDETMLKTFPNLKVTNTKGEIVHIRDILTDITPYYFKVFTPKG